MAKMTLADLKAMYGVYEPGGMDRRKSKATKKGHIHKHNPTYLPHSGPALTHAYYRRMKMAIPNRKKAKKA